MFLAFTSAAAASAETDILLDFTLLHLQANGDVDGFH